jgi:hypothetical protein
MLDGQKFDRKRNCFLNTTANHTDECITELNKNGQKLHQKFHKRVIRAKRKDEKNGDLWMHMKYCKGCN